MKTAVLTDSNSALSPSTTGIVDREFLQRLRPEAILINTRCPGLDVLEHEPPAPDHPFIPSPAKREGESKKCP